ncbi:hypothetical protein PYCCODRAFT_362942 [Trametes coccinea BRFM310]|uniref:Uncharacterized protein n=1 Tax=Trametes coccinea (strain BRFM310) TaxID=1353009 RepID=A0A1Y2J3A6_TRAC3|nr:hypothetical protein PYCCODRAFT_362942 [Trametes coccinea BRFM310]
MGGVDPQRNVLKAPRIPSYNLHITIHPPRATMSSHPLNVYTLLKDLSSDFPGDHTLFVRSEAHGFPQGPDRDTLAAPVAALMPSIVIKSYTTPSITLSHSLIPGQDVVDIAPFISSPVVGQMLDIISLARQGYHSALLLEEGSLVVWAANLKDGLRLFIETQKAVSAWYASCMMLPSSYTDDVYPSRPELSLDRYSTYSEPPLVRTSATEWQNTAKLPSFAEYNLRSAPEPFQPNHLSFSSPAVVRDSQDLSPLCVPGASDGPMLADFPADHSTPTDVYNNAPSLSCDYKATLSPDYTVVPNLMPTLMDSSTSDDEALDDELATPYSIAPSQFSSPRFQDADLTAASDFWSIMPDDQLIGAHLDLFKAVDKQPMGPSSPPRLSPEPPCTQEACEIPERRSVDERSFIEPAKSKKRPVRQQRRSSKRRTPGSPPRTVPADVTEGTTSVPLRGSEPRASPALRDLPVRNQPHRVLRSARISAVQNSASPLLASVASPSKALSAQDDLSEAGSEDDDAEGYVDDDSDDDEYKPGPQRDSSSLSCKSTSSKRKRAPLEPAEAPDRKKSRTQGVPCNWCPATVSRPSDMPRHLMTCAACPDEHRPEFDIASLYCKCHGTRFARPDARMRHERAERAKGNNWAVASVRTSRTRSGNRPSLDHD